MKPASWSHLRRIDFQEVLGYLHIPFLVSRADRQKRARVFKLSQIYQKSPGGARRKTELQAVRKQLSEAVRGEAIKEAQEQLMKWRNEELENTKTQMREVLLKEAALALEQWKAETEKEIRQDAITKSHSVTMGKMTEHFVPFLPGFEYNPKDARYIGSPVDLVVFDGLDEGYVRKVVFAEIKTGASSLSTRERWVRDAILARNIEWIEIKVNLNGQEVVQKVAPKRSNGEVS